jgi:hypothetical protein
MQLLRKTGLRNVVFRWYYPLMIGVCHGAK